MMSVTVGSNYIYIENDEETLESVYQAINNDSIMSKDTSQGYPIYTFHPQYDIHVRNDGILTIGNPSDYSYKEVLVLDITATYNIKFNIEGTGTLNMYGNTEFDLSKNGSTHGLNSIYGEVNIIGDDTYRPHITHWYYNYIAPFKPQQFINVDFDSPVASYGKLFYINQPAGTNNKIYLRGCKIIGYGDHYSNLFQGEKYTVIEMDSCEIGHFSSLFYDKGSAEMVYMHDCYIHDIAITAYYLKAGTGFTKSENNHFERVNSSSDTSGNNMAYHLFASPVDYVLYSKGDIIDDVGHCFEQEGGEVWFDKDNNMNWDFYTGGGDKTTYKTQERNITIQDEDGNEIEGAIVSFNGEQYRTYTYQAGGITVVEKLQKYNWDTSTWEDYDDIVSVVADQHLPYVGELDDVIVLQRRLTGSNQVPKILEMKVEDYR